MRSALQRGVDDDRYHGAVVMIGVHGEVVMEEAFGYADRSSGRLAKVDDVFRVASITKAFTASTVHRAMDEGLLSLNTRVVEVIPEFATAGEPQVGKSRVTVGHLLSHCSGLPPTPRVVPLELTGNLAATVAAACATSLVEDPGTSLIYSPTMNHALLGEMVRRVHGADHVRDVMRDELFDPLGMKDSALGMPDHLAPRAVPIRACTPKLSSWLDAKGIEMFNDVMTAEAEMPWVGAASTAADVYRLAELYRRGGELDGRRLLSQALVSRVTTNETFDWPNMLFADLADDPVNGFELGPGYYSYGFNLSGASVAPSMFGTLTSPATYGYHAGGTSLFWIDPVHDVTMVCLGVGVMPEPDAVFRYQHLSDLVIGSVT
ncbi:serine hydrolase domain-containing protein [Aeromicrobium wangtongii]|uniref:serine hydrolase domain-containing protein n=1 Tax=Aeromicrobium wangtongii TaxID=2969247 RepID=UPI002018351F|nr:serine hydrolase domain-containing protein [Aeromicrobium wangtongii]MCL3819408.1 beta-lactamase family protein [Aeromicrobium wangtongii]